ncbi:MAG: phosphoenolpyruvate---glycerone phosphotransferase subunit DhaL [Streptosporangiaceae bacterium]|nr:phosphoenolpyruvate---glycerone phosphotransferase subunit DhaL [Streptosporangiaceae bacterium]
MDTATALAWVRAIAAAVHDKVDLLTQLDSAIGDADHGTNLQRGFTAVLTALDGRDFATPGEVLVKTGTTLISTVGGASGPLYGSAFRATGKQLTEPAATADQLRVALTAGLEAVQKLGAATPGDKTMIDAYVPALDAFGEALNHGADLKTAAGKAAAAAEAGMRATIPMIARKGRASYLGARSEGHQDPGATSTALVFRALAEVVSA